MSTFEDHLATDIAVLEEAQYDLNQRPDDIESREFRKEMFDSCIDRLRTGTSTQQMGGLRKLLDLGLISEREKRDLLRSFKAKISNAPSVDNRPPNIVVSGDVINAVAVTGKLTAANNTVSKGNSMLTKKPSGYEHLMERVVKAINSNSILAQTMLTDQTYYVPESAEYFERAARKPSSPRKSEFQEPYIFLDRFTKKKANNQAIANSTASRVARQLDLGDPQHVMIIECPRQEGSVLSKIKHEDKLYLQETSIKSILFLSQPERSFVSYREILALKEYLEELDITLYAILGGKIQPVSFENSLSLCGPAVNDWNAAKEKGHKSDASQKLGKRQREEESAEPEVKKRRSDRLASRAGETQKTPTKSKGSKSKKQNEK